MLSAIKRITFNTNGIHEHRSPDPGRCLGSRTHSRTATQIKNPDRHNRTLSVKGLSLLGRVNTPRVHVESPVPRWYRSAWLRSRSYTVLVSMLGAGPLPPPEIPLSLRNVCDHACVSSRLVSLYAGSHPQFILNSTFCRSAVAAGRPRACACTRAPPRGRRCSGSGAAARQPRAWTAVRGAPQRTALRACAGQVC